MIDIIEINVETGERIERDFTAEEISQRDKDTADAAKAAKEQAAREKADAETRAAAIGHAKSLGFTDAMIAVMYPNLGAQS